jgi:hypothetical protein
MLNNIIFSELRKSAPAYGYYSPISMQILDRIWTISFEKPEDD